MEFHMIAVFFATFQCNFAMKYLDMREVQLSSAEVAFMSLMNGL